MLRVLSDALSRMAVDANTVHARFLDKLASQKFLFVYSKYITIPSVAVGFGGGRGFAYAPSKKIP